MSLILPLLVAGDVEEGRAACADDEQDGDDGKDHEDDESCLTQLYQQEDVIHVT